MTKTNRTWQRAALPLAIGLVSFAGAANAANFSWGELDGQFDSQLSIGASMSTANPDKRFIHTATRDSKGNLIGGQAASRTSDDGKLNYKKGDFFSKIFKGSHDLELRYGDSGAFLRGNYWYDFETKDGSQRFYDISDKGRNPLQKGSGVQLLDAFVYHNYSIGNNPGNVRLGRQVVSWGEGVFIQNGINSINPIDVSAFRRPGAELKEGLLPVEMLYLSQGLTDTLSMEAFYQLKWAPTVVDNCGTFFATDVLARGCYDRLIVDGPDLPQGDDRLLTGGPGNTARYIVRAEKDREARDDGQYGVAFRLFVPELNDTEFGFFHMNYHSRTPVYSNIRGYGLAGLMQGRTVAGLDGASGQGGYFLDYPENIRLYGVSFQTDVAGASVAGELSYRPNMPMQINTGDMSATALSLSNSAGTLAALAPPLAAMFPNFAGFDFVGRGMPADGSEIRGYDRKEFWQASVSAVHFIDRVAGADRLSMVGEVAYNRIGGLGSKTSYGRDSLFGQSPLPDSPLTSIIGKCPLTAANSPAKAQSWCENDGFYTSNSWGYRLRASLEYSNVIAGINLTPNLAFSHDVEGYSPNFTENAKSVSIGVNADYGNKYNASLSYTNFFDGKYNTLVDRDFAAVSVGMSF